MRSVSDFVPVPAARPSRGANRNGVRVVQAGGVLEGIAAEGRVPTAISIPGLVFLLILAILPG